jgi:hypothetical protein
VRFEDRGLVANVVIITSQDSCASDNAGFVYVPPNVILEYVPAGVALEYKSSSVIYAARCPILFDLNRDSASLAIKVDPSRFSHCALPVASPALCSATIAGDREK